MDNFIYSIPTTAYFGKGQINILGKTILSTPFVSVDKSLLP